MKRIKRGLCLLLALVLVLGYVPGALQVRASLEDGLCALHHPEHSTEECGYVAQVQGSECNHAGKCDANCLTKEVTQCVYPHENCGCQAAADPVECDHGPEAGCDYAARIAAITCDCAEVDAEGAVIHGAECTLEAQKAAVKCDHYVSGQEAVYCGHQCSVDTECVTMQCSHVHSEACGYSEGVKGEPCKFAGKPCQQCEAENSCLGADVCVNGVHVADCPLNQEPKCAKDENCTRTENHEEGCPVGAMQQTPDDAADMDGYSLMMGDSYFDENSPEKMYFKLYFCQNAEDMTEQTQLDNSDFANITIEDTTVAFSLAYEMNGYFSVWFARSNVPTYLIYSSYGEDLNNPDIYKLEIRKIETGRKLWSRFKGEEWLQENSEMLLGQQFKLQFFQGSKEHGPDMGYAVKTGISGDGEIISVSAAPDEDGYYTVTALKEGNGTIRYKIGDTLIGEYSVSVISSEGIRLFFWETDENGFLPPEMGIHSNNLTISPGDSVQGRFMLGKQNGGPRSEYKMPGTLEMPENSTITMDYNSQSNNHIISGIGNGKVMVTYKEGNLVCSMEIMVLGSASDENVLHFAQTNSNGNTYPVTCMNLPTGNSLVQKFYFGSQQLSYADVENQSLTASGSIEVLDGGNGKLKIRAIKNADNTFRTGTGYLEYKTIEGEGEDQKIITNCFVVNVVDPYGYRAPTGTQGGSYLHYGDTVIGFGDLSHSVSGDTEAMILDHEVTGGFSDVYYEPFRHNALLAAIGSDGQPDMNLLTEKIENVKFSVLSCWYTNGAPASGDELTLVNEDAVWYEIGGGVGSWMNTYASGGTTDFRAVVGMRFDLREGETIRRIALHTNAHNMFMGNDVRVYADDIYSAKQLNVILSSYESLVNWVKKKPYNENDTGREWVETACSINIILPPRKLTDAVVVSQAIANKPFTDRPISTPDFRIYLHGSDKGNNQTVLAGMVSKGSVFGVRNILFEADPKITMTRDDQEGEFTCGIMADPKWNGTVEYDKDTMITTETGASVSFFDYYAVDPENRTLDSWNDDIAYWHSDIVSMGECTFKGFDFGVYSTPNGYVGGGADITITDCYYGLYIDSAKKPFWNNLKSYSDYDGYNFKKNVVAVRIKGLQGNMTPYEFRIHDSDFINNYLEFWIDRYTDSSDPLLHNYYFYRNHYRGGWKLNSGNGGSEEEESSGYGWVNAEKVPDNQNLPDVHRAPRYSDTLLNQTDNGVQVVISGTPGKATPNLASNAVNRSTSGDGYWIYDGTDQVTRILSNQNLPLAQESLNSLNKAADVSVVTEDGSDTIAIWTFEGGE